MAEDKLPCVREESMVATRSDKVRRRAEAISLSASQKASSRLTLPADLEVAERPLRLRAPVAIRRNGDGAKRIGFSARRSHGQSLHLVLFGEASSATGVRREAAHDCIRERTENSCRTVSGEGERRGELP